MKLKIYGKMATKSVGIKENHIQNGEASNYQLHTACKKGQRDIVLQLINDGHDVNSKDSKDLTLLDEAINGGRKGADFKSNVYIEIVKILLKHGANLKDKYKSFLPSRHSRFDDKFAELLIEEGIITKLHMACRKGQKNKVLQLIKDGHDVSSQTSANLTPLDEAIIGGRTCRYNTQLAYLDIVKILLKHGAHCTDKQKSFVRYYSSFDHELAKILVEEEFIDLNAVNEKGETLMDLAIKNGVKSMILLLLEKGADCNIKNSAGQMPIHVAISMLKDGKSYIDIVNLLIDHYTDLNVCNDIKNTPLHLAVKSGHLEIVRKLIQKGAIFDSRNNQGLTPAQVAIIENHTKIARFFIEIGKYNQLEVLITAVKKGNTQIVKLLLEEGVIDLTCCAAKRQQVRAPHRKLLTKVHVGLKGH